MSSNVESTLSKIAKIVEMRKIPVMYSIEGIRKSLYDISTSCSGLTRLDGSSSNSNEMGGDLTTRLLATLVEALGNDPMPSSKKDIAKMANRDNIHEKYHKALLSSTDSDFLNHATEMCRSVIAEHAIGGSTMGKETSATIAAYAINLMSFLCSNKVDRTGNERTMFCSKFEAVMNSEISSDTFMRSTASHTIGNGMTNGSASTISASITAPMNNLMEITYHEMVDFPGAKLMLVESSTTDRGMIFSNHREMLLKGGIRDPGMTREAVEKTFFTDLRAHLRMRQVDDSPTFVEKAEFSVDEWHAIRWYYQIKKFGPTAALDAWFPKRPDEITICGSTLSTAGMVHEACCKWYNNLEKCGHPIAMVAELMDFLKINYNWVMACLLNGCSTSLNVVGHLAKKEQNLNGRALEIQDASLRFEQSIISAVFKSMWNGPNILTDISAKQHQELGPKHIGSMKIPLNFATGNPNFGREPNMLPNASPFNRQAPTTTPAVHSDSAEASAHQNWSFLVTTALYPIMMSLTIGSMAQSTSAAKVPEIVAAMADVCQDKFRRALYGDESDDQFLENVKRDPAMMFVARSLSLWKDNKQKLSSQNWLKSYYGENYNNLIQRNVEQVRNMDMATSAREADKSKFTDATGMVTNGFMAMVYPNVSHGVANMVHRATKQSAFIANTKTFFGDSADVLRRETGQTSKKLKAAPAVQPAKLVAPQPDHQNMALEDVTAGGPINDQVAVHKEVNLPKRRLGLTFMRRRAPGFHLKNRASEPAKATFDEPEEGANEDDDELVAEGYEFDEEFDQDEEFEEYEEYEDGEYTSDYGSDWGYNDDYG